MGQPHTGLIRLWPCVRTGASNWATFLLLRAARVACVAVLAWAWATVAAVFSPTAVSRAFQCEQQLFQKGRHWRVLARVLQIESDAHLMTHPRRVAPVLWPPPRSCGFALLGMAAARASLWPPPRSCGLALLGMAAACTSLWQSLRAHRM